METLRDTRVGFFLGDGKGNEVLLPGPSIPAGLEVGDRIEVFIYRDSEDRPVATTKVPKLILGEFALLEVVDTTSFGAFLDWGLEKDLLLPSREQRINVKKGDRVLAYLILDPMSDRLVATTKWEDHLDSEEEYYRNQMVDLIIAQQTELGFKAIINGEDIGLIYKNEIFEELRIGQEITGYIKTIRPDGKIDLKIRGNAVIELDGDSRKIMAHLKSSGGEMNIHDKSDPALIRSTFSMSKKSFKKALGSLYKKRLIRMEKNSVHLVDKTL